MHESEMEKEGPRYSKGPSTISPLTSELFILTQYSVTKTELSYFLILN